MTRRVQSIGNSEYYIKLENPTMYIKTEVVIKIAARVSVHSKISNLTINQRKLTYFKNKNTTNTWIGRLFTQRVRSSFQKCKTRRTWTLQCILVDSSDDDKRKYISSSFNNAHELLLAYSTLYCSSSEKKYSHILLHQILYQLYIFSLCCPIFP